MQKEIIEELDYNRKIAFSYIGIFFCFMDFIFGFIYFLISKNYMNILSYLLLIITLDILQRLFEIVFFQYELNIKTLIIFILSTCQFYIIIGFIYKIISHLDLDRCETNFHKFFTTSIFAVIIFPYEQIIESSTYFNFLKFILMIIIACYLNYFIRKKIKEFIVSVFDKIGDNIFLFGILYNIPYLIYFSAFGYCSIEFLKIYLNDELYVSYFSFGNIIFKELIKNGMLIFLAGILYLYIIDVEVKNVNKPVEIKVEKMWKDIKGIN